MSLNSQRQRGFSLIEVMIASLILVVGITGFATLQNQIVESDQRLKLRSIATQIARQKVNELRYFERNQKNQESTSFEDISNDNGGKTEAGEIEMVESLQHDNKLKFAQHWQVVDQYYVDTNNDGIADNWVTADNPNAPKPLPALPGRKDVSVTVEWAANDENTESYVLHTVIAPIPLNRSVHVFNQSPDNTLTAKIKAPDKVHENTFKHTLSGEIGQTSTPVTFDQQHNISSFDTFKYRNNNEEMTLIEKKEMAFVRCNCTLAGTKKAKSPSQIKITNNAIDMRNGQWINKTTGIAEPNQTKLCDSCCRDHHDNADMLKSQQFFRQEAKTAHKHYKLQNHGNYIQALSNGDEYDEVCRFQRIDGDYQILPDIHAIKTITLPDSKLNQEQQAQYRRFVIEVLKNHVLQKPLPQSPFAQNITMSPSATQLTLRSIYLEPLIRDDKSKIRQMIIDGNSKWLALTPFYDLDMTLQAAWSSLDSGVAIVTNERKDVAFAPKDQRYASFSRGRLIALDIGGTQISSKLVSTNEGLIGTPPISPYNDKQRLIESSFELTVRNKHVGMPTVGFVMSIFCISTQENVHLTCSERQYAQLEKLQVSTQDKQANCNVEIQIPPNTSFINCSELPENWQGYIFIDAEKVDSKLSFAWTDVDKQIIVGPKLKIGQPMSATSYTDYWLLVEF